MQWMRFLAVAVLCVCAVNARAQTVDPSARLAALRYALANGLVVQRDSVVVAWDRAGEVLAKPELEAAKLEARAMAQLVGPRARDTSEKSVLECFRMAGDASAAYQCASSTRNAVIVVAREHVSRSRSTRDSTWFVIIDVFSPGLHTRERSWQSILVSLSRTTDGWIGASPQSLTWVVRPIRATTIPNLLHGSREMSDGEQREMELAAVRYLIARDTSRYTFSGFGLDQRLYVHEWNKPANRNSSFLSVSAKGRNPGHLAALGQVLGTSAVIHDATSCAVFRPSPCRMGALPGAVAFTQGLVKETTAQISLFRIARETPVRGTIANGMVGWRFTFRKTGTEWIVADMQVHSDR